jgi:hypothetical protein
LTDDDDITVESSAKVGAEDAVSQVPSHITSLPAPVDEGLSQVGSEADAVSVVPSQTPTEVLAKEYKKLMDEYDTICVGNKKLEETVEEMKQHW